MNYVMEHEEEAKRLEFQAKQEGYSALSELQYLDLSKNPRVLDAGCGTGLISRTLLELRPQAKVFACDQSDIRIAQARKINKNLNIEFSRQHLEKTEFQNESFDCVVSRYVLEHVQEPSVIVNEMARILAPEGVCYLIDFDGIFLNYHTSNPSLNSMLEKIKKGLSIDLYIGRKMPALLKEAGLKNVQWKMETLTFQGEKELEEEYYNTQERCRFAFPQLAEILGGESEASKFVELYLQELKSPETCLFYNKFIAWGTK